MLSLPAYPLALAEWRPGPGGAAAAPWQPDPVLGSLLVQQLVFGADGYGWVATDAGVRRYDGYAAVPLAQLLRPGSAAAPAGYVQLALDRAGQLWISHETGLYCFAPATSRLTQVPLPLAPAERPLVNALWLDTRTGHLWVGYGNGRLLRLNPARPRLPARPPASCTGGAAVLSFAPATDGAVWATAGDGGAILELEGRGRLRRRYPSPGEYVVPVPGTRPQFAVNWSTFYAACGRGGAGWLPALRHPLPARPRCGGPARHLASAGAARGVALVGGRRAAGHHHVQRGQPRLSGCPAPRPAIHRGARWGGAALSFQPWPS